jgi:hypothetical protein
MGASRTWRVLAIIAALLVACAMAPMVRAADAVPDDVKAQVLDRYRVLLIQDGVVLTPRQETTPTIEIRGGAIAIDGTPVSGRELRERVGKDADLIIQLSYSSPDALRAAFGSASEAPSVIPPVPQPSAPAPSVEPPPPVPAPPAPPEPPRIKHGAKVRFGDDITVEEDEIVSDAVVAIGGHVRVLGHVQGDVVAVGGGVELGPRAEVDGSVTSVGGRVEQERGAQIHGEVSEVAFPGGHWAPGVLWGGAVHDFMGSSFRLFGTALRIAVVLLLCLVVVVIAERPVSRIARRAGDEPWLSGFVGLLAQVLVVPLTVLTVVVLAVSIIGIPLLLLVPFALLALLVGALMGFVGVARRVGLWVVGPKSPAVATAVGVVLVAAGTILARLLGMLPGPIAPLAFVVAVIGFFLEFVAWTVGLGALLLTRFGTRGPAMLDLFTPGVPPPVPPVPPVPHTPEPPPIPFSDPPIADPGRSE